MKEKKKREISYKINEITIWTVADVQYAYSVFVFTMSVF